MSLRHCDLQIRSLPCVAVQYAYYVASGKRELIDHWYAHHMFRLLAPLVCTSGRHRVRFCQPLVCIRPWARASNFVYLRFCRHPAARVTCDPTRRRGTTLTASIWGYGLPQRPCGPSARKGPTISRTHSHPYGSCGCSVACRVWALVRGMVRGA